MKYVQLIAFVIFIASCTGEEPRPIATEELVDPREGVDAPMNASVTGSGTFTSFAHSLAGHAALYTDAKGERTLRFENFTMTMGPDVYVLFSKSNNYSEANTIPIAMLKAAYSGTTLNFDVPPSVNLSSHPFVLVYCVQFSSLFGYSELKP